MDHLLTWSSVVSLRSPALSLEGEGKRNAGEEAA